MILVHIISKNKKQALEIITVLLKKRLLLHGAISKKTLYRNNRENDQLEEKKQTLIIGKTKALLFNAINEELKTNFTKNCPLLYAVPIVYTDAELANTLRESTAKV